MAFIFIFMFVLVYPGVLRYDPFAIIRLITFNYYGNTLGLNGIGDMWSLSIEMQYYLIAPFIFSIFNSIKQNKLRISILIATIIIFSLIKLGLNHYFLKVNNSNPMFASLLGNFPFFLTGFLFNYVQVHFITVEKFNKIKFFFTKDIILIVIFCAGFLILNFDPNIKNSSDLINHLVIRYLLISIATGCLISILDNIDNKKDIKKYSLFKIIQILGALSYGIYLWHSGIASVHSQLFSNGFSSFNSYLTEILYIAFITVFIAFITYVLIEERFNEYKKFNLNDNKNK
jgi:peptidoglycan/LPS O-acetylase OafA/YrhL